VIITIGAPIETTLYGFEPQYPSNGNQEPWRGKETEYHRGRYEEGDIQ
jgi:hypothetical protein